MTRPAPAANNQLQKSPTGIQGLDEIIGGGLPKGRPTLVCGGAGCGKTLLAMEFLVRGAINFNEPGVFMAFEENAQDLAQNVASLGFDLEDLVAHKKMLIDFVYLERSEIVDSGDFDLEGLFIRLGLAIDSIGAKRVVLDTIESLFASLPNQLVLRAELRRLFRWLKDKGVTAIITGESGNEMLTRQGLEDYVSDCVIKLDHRVTAQTSTRRLRIVKYRGSTHGTNEYPFLIDEEGISVLPVTSLGLQHTVSLERIPSGIDRLDTMLGGRGYYRGSSILVSGTAGTGKSSLAAQFADAACRRGERTLYFAFEESDQQIIRNMRSIGLDLEPWVQSRLLQFRAIRPTFFGLEMHLSSMHKAIVAFKPEIVIVDPLNSFIAVGDELEFKSMLMRLVDFLKSNQITGFFTCLISGGDPQTISHVTISSLIDTWLLLRDIESSGERNRGLIILKSRGMPHSNQIREFLITDRGLKLQDVYVGTAGVLTGSARLQQEAQDNANKIAEWQAARKQRIGLESRRNVLEAQITALRAELAVQDAEMKELAAQQLGRDAQLLKDDSDIALSRKADIMPEGAK